MLKDLSTMLEGEEEKEDVPLGDAPVAEEAAAEQEAQPEEPKAEEKKARPRSESWLSRFAKKVGDSAKKVFAKKERVPAPAPAPADAEGDATVDAPAEQPAAPAPAPKGKFPAVGQRCATPYGDGLIAALTTGEAEGDEGAPELRAEVHLDWHLADGSPVKAYVSAAVLKRPLPKILKEANKALHKVGDAIAGDNGLFGKNTWNRIGNGFRKAGGAVKQTADKVFKKRAVHTDGNAAESAAAAETHTQKEEETAETAAPVESKEAPAEEAEPAAADEGEGENPYM